MNNFPKISVFLPAYNHASFIGEAIDSILIQEYPNIEIVIGDDCSKDETREIIMHYVKQFPKIIRPIFHSENIGVTANCNAILKHCDGEFVALFSGDDVWLPGKLKAQLDWFSQNQDGVLCFTKTEVIDKKGTVLRQAVFPNDNLLKENILMATWLLGESGASFLIKSLAIPLKGFPREIPIFSDWYFWNAIAFKGKVGGIDHVYTRYRKHTNSTSGSNILIMLLDHLKCLTMLKNDFPEKKELIDREIEKKLVELLFKNDIDTLKFYGLKDLGKEIIKRFLNKR